jgi:hypothetical protein
MILPHVTLGATPLHQRVLRPCSFLKRAGNSARVTLPPFRKMILSCLGERNTFYIFFSTKVYDFISVMQVENLMRSLIIFISFSSFLVPPSYLSVYFPLRRTKALSLLLTAITLSARRMHANYITCSGFYHSNVSVYTAEVCNGRATSFLFCYKRPLK